MTVSIERRLRDLWVRGYCLVPWDWDTAANFGLFEADITEREIRLCVEKFRSEPEEAV